MAGEIDHGGGELAPVRLRVAGTAGDLAGRVAGGADAFDLLLAGALRQGGRAQGLTPRGAGQGAGKHNSGEGGGESGKQQLQHRKTSPSCCYVLLPKGSRGRRPQVDRKSTRLNSSH